MSCVHIHPPIEYIRMLPHFNLTGMDKKPVAKEVTPFVTFAVNGSSLPADGSSKNSTKPMMPKKIGF